MADEIKNKTNSEGEADKFRLAFDTAVKYLSASPRSEKEVKEKLYQKGFHCEETDDTLEKLKKYRYVDDEQYVSDFVDSYRNKYGKKKIEDKLINEKGISKETARRIVGELLDEGGEKEKCVSYAKKYAAAKHLEPDKKGKAKLGNYLYSKGFEWNVINAAVEKLLGGETFED